MKCPKCQRRLAEVAESCLCGWQKGERISAGVPCSADPQCRYVGRMFLRGMNPNDRICVNHYYRALENGEQHEEAPMRAA